MMACSPKNVHMYFPFSVSLQDESFLEMDFDEHFLSFHHKIIFWWNLIYLSQALHHPLNCNASLRKSGTDTIFIVLPHWHVVPNSSNTDFIITISITLPKMDLLISVKKSLLVSLRFGRSKSMYLQNGQSNKLETWSSLVLERWKPLVLMKFKSKWCSLGWPSAWNLYVSISPYLGHFVYHCSNCCNMVAGASSRK